MDVAVPAERFPLPDFRQRGVPCIREELRCTEGDVLTTESDSSKGVDVQTFERPHARSLLLGRQIAVEMAIERFALGDCRVVVPGEEFPSYDLIDTNRIHPEVDCRVKLPL